MAVAIGPSPCPADRFGRLRWRRQLGADKLLMVLDHQQLVSDLGARLGSGGSSGVSDHHVFLFCCLLTNDAVDVFFLLAESSPGFPLQWMSRNSSEKDFT